MGNSERDRDNGERMAYEWKGIGVIAFWAGASGFGSLHQTSRRGKVPLRKSVAVWRSTAIPNMGFGLYHVLLQAFPVSN
jgi:hypothetical protein